MRKVDFYSCNDLNDGLVITADDPDESGSSHAYSIVDKFPGETPHFVVGTKIEFQKGPVKENGLNGISNESLLAVVIDRLQGFQKGPYVCRENALALTKCEEALMWLNKRTQDRIARGVEGKNEK